MNKKLLVGLLVVGGMTVSFSSFAYQNNFGYQNNSGMINGHYKNPSNMPAVNSAIENKDFAAWSALMSGKNILTKVNTQDKFNKFVDMHYAFQKGDKTTGESIAEQLGIEKKSMKGKGKCFGKSGTGQRSQIDSLERQSFANMQEIEKALKNNDYAKRSELMSGKGPAVVINTQEKFQLFVQMQTAFKNGNKTTGEKLLKQLGLDNANIKGLKKGMNKRSSAGAISK